MKADEKRGVGPSARPWCSGRVWTSCCEWYLYFFPGSRQWSRPSKCLSLWVCQCPALQAWRPSLLGSHTASSVLPGGGPQSLQNLPHGIPASDLPFCSLNNSQLPNQPLQGHFKWQHHFLSQGVTNECVCSSWSVRNGLENIPLEAFPQQRPPTTPTHTAPPLLPATSRSSFLSSWLLWAFASCSVPRPPPNSPTLV